MASAWVHTGALSAIGREQQAHWQERTLQASPDHQSSPDHQDAKASIDHPADLPLHGLLKRTRDSRASSTTADAMYAAAQLQTHTDILTLAELTAELGHTVHSTQPACDVGEALGRAVLDTTIVKDALDNASKDIDHKTFSPEFRIQIFFTTEPMAALRQALLRQVARMGIGSSTLPISVPTDSRLRHALAARKAIIEQSFASGWQ
jgi:hypothetical protein